MEFVKRLIVNWVTAKWSENWPFSVPESEAGQEIDKAQLWMRTMWIIMLLSKCRWMERLGEKVVHCKADSPFAENGFEREESEYLQKWRVSIVTSDNSLCPKVFVYVCMHARELIHCSQRCANCEWKRERRRNFIVEIEMPCSTYQLSPICGNKW